MVQRTAIKYFAKLNKAATENFGMLKSVHSEEYLSRTRVSE
jgi:hypothetical protein